MADETARHDRHHLELVAAHAIGDAPDTALDGAQELIDSCDRCFDLARDLRALALGLQALPDAERVAARRQAPRDFRITPEQAAQLRPTRGAARWLTLLGSAIAGFGRPLGASMATLGVVGLLVATITFGVGGIGGTGGTDGGRSMSLEMASQAPAGDGVTTTGAGAPEPESTNDLTRAVGPAATPARDDSDGSPGTDTGALQRDTSGATAWLFGGSAVLLIVGLGLIVVATRGRARSRRDGETP